MFLSEIVFVSSVECVFTLCILQRQTGACAFALKQYVIGVAWAKKSVQCAFRGVFLCVKKSSKLKYPLIKHTNLTCFRCLLTTSVPRRFIFSCYILIFWSVRWSCSGWVICKGWTDSLIKSFLCHCTSSCLDHIHRLFKNGTGGASKKYIWWH